MKRLMLVWMLCTSLAWAGEAQPLAENPQVEARLVVIELIAQGMPAAQIKTSLVERFGDFVLYRPPARPLTWPLWFGPFLLLALAVWGLWRYMRQRKALVQQRMTEADNAQADSLLKD